MDAHFTNLYNYHHEENKMNNRKNIYYSGRTGLVRFLYKHEDWFLIPTLILIGLSPLLYAYYLLIQ